MERTRAYKTKLVPNRQQENYLRQCGRVARTVFNWCLTDYLKDYRSWHSEFTQSLRLIKGDEPGDIDWKAVERDAKRMGIALPKKPRSNGLARKKKLNRVKKDDPALSKMMRYPYVILQSAVDNFDAAFDNYERKKKNGEVARSLAEIHSDPVKSGRYKRRIAKKMERGCIGNELDPDFPRYKSRFDEVKIKFEGNSVKLGDGWVSFPKLGKVKIAECGYIPLTPNKLCYASVESDGNVWYVSVTVTEAFSPPAELKPVTLGVSIGIIDTAGTSTGIIYENPKIYDQYEARKVRLGRELSRRSHKDADGKVIKGANWKKTKKKLAKLESKIARARKHHLHSTSKAITETLPSVIVVKDMDIQQLQKGEKPAKRRINRKIADAGMGELRRQIEYKAGWNGTEVIASKERVAEICSGCGKPSATINYTTKMMTCPCGHTQRASVNMAINLSRKEIDHA